MTPDSTSAGKPFASQPPVSPNTSTLGNPIYAYRICLAILIGLLSGSVCYVYQAHFQPHGGDFGWILHSVPPLLAGQNPYQATAQDWPLRYPLITLLTLIPFAWLPYPLAAALFFGLSSAGLAYGLMRTHMWRLLVFLCFPFYGALQVAQWAPLLGIAYLYPTLVPITMLKPSIGLPIALTTRITKRDIFIVGIAIALSFVLLPTWVGDMIRQFAAHPNVTPVLSIPGLVLIALVALRWQIFRHSREAWFILLLACIPQTLFYDTFLLSLTLPTRRALLLFVVCSWIAYIGWFFAPWLEPTWLIIFLYLPAMALVLGVIPTQDESS